jgi:hypothetical protein
MFKTQGNKKQVEASSFSVVFTVHGWNESGPDLNALDRVRPNKIK